MKKLLLILLLITVGIQTYAQQDPQYSLYIFNPMGLNPAYAGSREVLSAVLVNRSQWVGLKGAPTTQTLAINAPLKNKKMGLGLQFYNDQIGPKKVQSLTAAYAYRLKLGRGKLAFGLQGGILNYTYDWAAIEYKNKNDQLPKIAADNFVIPTFDFGIYYNTRTFYVGIAADHLNQSDFGLLNKDIGATSSAQLATHFTTTIGKAFEINNNVVLKTSMLIRSDDVQDNHVDLNASVVLKQKVTFGLTLRSSKGFSVILEMQLSKKIRMGYAYDYDTTELTKNVSGGSHEIFIGYDVSLFKSKVISPRYF